MSFVFDKTSRISLSYKLVLIPRIRRWSIPCCTAFCPQVAGCCHKGGACNRILWVGDTKLGLTLIFLACESVIVLIAVFSSLRIC